MNVLRLFFGGHLIREGHAITGGSFHICGYATRRAAPLEEDTLVDGEALLEGGKKSVVCCLLICTLRGTIQDYNRLQRILQEPVGAL